MAAAAAAPMGAQQQWGGSKGLWDNGAIDHARLVERASFYAQAAGAPEEMKANMVAMITSETGRMILDIPVSELVPHLVNDAYKPKMHAMYGRYLAGVEADFALNVRKTPFPLKRIKDEDPELWEEFLSAVEAMRGVPPLPEETAALLREYFSLDPSRDMLERAARNGVAPIEMREVAGEVVGFARGPVEAASHCETSMMQLVQQYTVRAQARALQRERGLKLDRTERLGNSLGKLAATTARLNGADLGGAGVVLMAGRRSSDRTFLLLQNLFFMKHLRAFTGTSAVWAVEELHRVLEATGVDAAGRAVLVRRLVGTHAHEEISLVSQLVAATDDAAGDAEQGPCQVGALLAHLLFFARHGIESATALGDTFGTRAFLAAAEAADVPKEFVEDIGSEHNQDVPEGACVADLIRLWRLDSGVYEEVAEMIKQSCERRPLAPPPKFMHSNLESVEHIVKMTSLPERIRPFALGFGTLADGFVPFEVPEGEPPAEIKLASVVMKAVQGRKEGGVAHPTCPCAGKRGDDVDAGKVQVDVRMTPEEQAAARARFDALSKHIKPDRARLSAALAAAYHAVTREKSLS